VIFHIRILSLTLFISFSSTFVSLGWDYTCQTSRKCSSEFNESSNGLVLSYLPNCYTDLTIFGFKTLARLLVNFRIISLANEAIELHFSASRHQFLQKVNSSLIKHQPIPPLYYLFFIQIVGALHIYVYT